MTHIDSSPYLPDGPPTDPFVMCHEARCPTIDGEYGIFEEQWHVVAEECPAWTSAEGIFPGTLVTSKVIDFAAFFEQRK
mgnify:FL=1